MSANVWLGDKRSSLFSSDVSDEETGLWRRYQGELADFSVRQVGEDFKQNLESVRTPYHWLALEAVGQSCV